MSEKYHRVRSDLTQIRTEASQITTMSTSTQHDGFSRKRKRDAGEDSKSEGIDDTTGGIRGLSHILEMPDLSRDSDERLLFNAIEATDFINNLERLMKRSFEPPGILGNIGIDCFGRLFITK